MVPGSSCSDCPTGQTRAETAILKSSLVNGLILLLTILLLYVTIAGSEIFVAMPFMLAVLLFFLSSLGSAQNTGFIYNGFHSADLALDYDARYIDGLLALTTNRRQRTGHAFSPDPVTFKTSSNGTVSSFSTTFVFAIIPEYPTLSGHGVAFVVVPERAVPWARPSQYFGLFNEDNIGNASNHIFAIELDTILSTEFRDINDNHVGIDFNGLDSASSAPAGYYLDKDPGRFVSLSLISGHAMQVWVEYNGSEKQINVTLAPSGVAKPSIPLLSLSFDLSAVIQEKMYVGFSSSTGSVLSSHCVLGWSFNMNGQAQELSLPSLPQVPRSVIKPESSKLPHKPRSKMLTIGMPMMSLFVILVGTLAAVCFIRKRKFTEVFEDWEVDYGPHRFKYKDLYSATKGFKDQELLGSGGFGKVYRGILPTSKMEIAVKRVSHDSRQGIREFVAEIVSIGRLRHRNLVTLLGYCRRKGELLLVYDYMPNGSLSKYLYNQQNLALKWSQRLRIIKGVASGLLYLHEEWEQVVIHRDIKPSNILLDANLNGRLGDFGLARLYNHGNEPQTTHVAGTLGYLAPEYIRTGKATKSTDVYAFGVFLLEVTSGRRPIEVRQREEDVALVEWVLSCWRRGKILEARDPKLENETVAEEVELVLKLGLLCLHSDPKARPSMRQVMQYMEGDMSVQELSSSLVLSASGLIFPYSEGFDSWHTSSIPAEDKGFLVSSRVVDALLSGGR